MKKAERKILLYRRFIAGTHKEVLCSELPVISEHGNVELLSTTPHSTYYRQTLILLLVLWTVSHLICHSSLIYPGNYSPLGFGC